MGTLAPVTAARRKDSVLRDEVSSGFVVRR